METIIIQADAKKAKAIKDFLKAFDITFKTSKKEESPYNPEFVKMVLEAREGKRKRINPSNIWESIS